MRLPAAFGRIERWEDARGFGFITPEEVGAGGPDRLFFHIRDYRGDGRPEVGVRVRYTPQRPDDGGRWRAVGVARPGARAGGAMGTASGRAHPQARVSAGLLLPVGLAWAGWLAFAVHDGRLPVATPGVLAVLNALTLVAYALDKHAARHGRRRTPEAHLHLLEVLGGWPAAALAQQMLRHKSAKTSYRRVFLTMVALHLAGLAAWSLA